MDTAGKVTHTPGPWGVQQTAEPNEIDILGPGPTGTLRYNVATVWGGGDANTETANANARLIAAAPELLGSVRELYATLRDGMQGDYDEMTAQLGRARALLARIDGDGQPCAAS